MKRVVTAALGGVFLAGFALADVDGNPEAGRKVAGMCRTCHGLDGFAKIPIAPHVAGEPVPYLVSQLTAFRDGRREHEMMTVVVRGLSDRQIADVSAWYGSQTVAATLKSAENEAPELCTGCHGLDGLSVVEDAPHLAGEANIYIETQLKAYRSGKRTHDVMSDVARDLTDEEIRQFANWFANIELTVEERVN